MAGSEVIVICSPVAGVMFVAVIVELAGSTDTTSTRYGSSVVPVPLTVASVTVVRSFNAVSTAEAVAGNGIGVVVAPPTVSVNSAMAGSIAMVWIDGVAGAAGVAATVAVGVAGV